MARNVIQMQKGLSLSECPARYGAEEKLQDAVRARRSPDGFVCLPCGCRDHAVVGKRQFYLCHGFPYADLVQGRDHLRAHTAAADQVVQGHVPADAVEELDFRTGACAPARRPA